VIPVDVYVPMPSPSQALLYGMLQLQRLIGNPDNLNRERLGMLLTTINSNFLFPEI